MTTETTTGPIKSGRPSKNTPKTRFWDRPLYGLLKTALPQHLDGDRLNPRLVAKALGIHKYTVYKWLNTDRLSPEGAKALVAESNGRLKIEDLISFIIA